MNDEPKHTATLPVRVQLPKGQLLIDGQWRDSAVGATMLTTDPTTEAVITEVARATPADAEAAVLAASSAVVPFVRTGFSGF